METNNEQLEKYGNLKVVMEIEGDGYFFFGYGLNSEYRDDPELVNKFEEASRAIDGFKTYVENQIIINGGNPEDWVA